MTKYVTKKPLLGLPVGTVFELDDTTQRKFVTYSGAADSWIYLCEDSIKADTENFEELRWNPRSCFDYNYIDNSGGVQACVWDGSLVDEERLAYGNVFKDKVTAEQAAKDIKQLLTQQDYNATS